VPAFSLSHHNALLSRLVIILVACAVVVGLGDTAATGNTTLWIVALVLACGVALLLVPTWWGLLIYFTFSAFSPLLKYVASYNTIVHLGPTLILAPILLRWVQERRGELGRDMRQLPLIKLVAAFVVLSGLMAFSPLTSPIVATGGIISYVLPIVFFPLAFTELRTRRRINAFVLWTVALATIGSVFTLIFVAIGPTRVASLGPAFAKAALDPGNAYIDPTAHTKGYIPVTVVLGGLGYLIALFMLLSLLIYGANIMGRVVRYLVAAPLIVLFAAAIVAPGVRLTIASTVIGLLIVVLAGRRRAIIPTLLGLVLAVLALNVVGSLTNGGPIGRAATLLDPTAALNSSGRSLLLAGAIPFALQNPLGQGMGRVGPGSGAVIAASGSSVTGLSFDNMLLAITSELGIAGGLLLSAIAVMFVVRGWQVYRRLTDGNLKAVALACTASSVAMTSSWIAGPTLMQAPGSIYFWALAGLCFALPHVEGRQVPG